MSALLKSLHLTAISQPDRLALQDSHASVTYQALDQLIAKNAHDLSAQGIRVLGLLADNGLAWALTDLSAISAEIPIVPLPLFFSSQQIMHVIQDAGLDAVLTDQPQQMQTLLQSANIQFHQVETEFDLHLFRLPGIAPKKLPPGTAKVTYTSGTTAEPKGVCLSLTQMETVAVSLREASHASATDRHLCLTPLSTLLENIGGIYTPLLSAASAFLPALKEVGLNGATSLDVARMLQALNQYQASSAILAPQMLQAIVLAGEAGAALPASLRFVAVGGAPVSSRLLKRAEHLGIPVCEGYGLSECASVVALNTRAHCRPDSVGLPLPHIAISIADDGEILVNGSTFLGYLGQPSSNTPWPTGDLGYLDAEGFLYLTGRKKSQFITSFGRNVSPEWIERELTLHPAILQAAIFGEGRPFNIAVIFARPDVSMDEINDAVASTNALLPDYAQVTTWLLAKAPFTPLNQQLTVNGRLKRDVILASYADAIESFYSEETNDVF